MSRKNSIWLCVALALWLPLKLNAKTVYPPLYLKMTHCLANQLTFANQVLAENETFKIVKVSTEDLLSLQLLADKARCGRFVNVTDLAKELAPSVNKHAWESILEEKSHQPLIGRKPSTYVITEDVLVEHLASNLSVPNILGTVDDLTHFSNRSSLCATGYQAALYLKNTFDKVAQHSTRKDVKTYFIDTGEGYQQPSLVTVIGEDRTNPAVVIGAHMDTLGIDESDRFPGAVDDGSGSASLMEIARTLLDSKQTFKRPIYMIWYAAEEVGLKGSRKVVQHFLDEGIPVEAVLQFDMTGYRSHALDKTIWIYEDYTDARLNQFVGELISHYLKIPIDYSRCGYGCSDHASWTAQGIPASLPFETRMEDLNPYIHSKNDVIDLINSEHIANFTKLGLAFAVELAMKD